MMPIVLRDYQLVDINRLRDLFRRGAKAPIYQLSTGGGKTVVFAHIVLGALAKNTRTLIVCHRRELIRQASAKLADLGVPHGIIAAGQDRDHDATVLVASIQTIANRLDKIPQFGLIVIDEAHHAVAKSWAKLLASQPNAKLLGVTATPARLDGRGLGKTAGGFFDAILTGPAMQELVDQGYLAATRVLVPRARIDTRGIRTLAGDYNEHELEGRATGVTGDCVTEFGKLRAETPTLTAMAFCVTVKHAELVRDAFQKAGYRAACVHGTQNKVTRDAAIQGLQNGAVEVLTSCEIISEGLDVPSVGCVILLRPTKSLTMALQQIGRGMRPKAGGASLVVLDHACNCLQHGLPTEPREWTLNGVAKRDPAKRSTWECPECQCLNPLRERTCAHCGFIRPAPAGKPRALPAPDDGEMAELHAMVRVTQLSYRQLMKTQRSEAELHAYARAHNYKPGWVFYRLQEQRERFKGA